MIVIQTITTNNIKIRKISLSQPHTQTLGDSVSVIDSNDGGPEEVSDVRGLGGILSLFPHRHWDQVSGSHSRDPGPCLVPTPGSSHARGWVRVWFWQEII